MSDGAAVAVAGAAALYVVLDALFGRQKLVHNLFLSTRAVDIAVERMNESVSQGRGVIDLIGAAAIFVPFALFDAARRAGRRSSLALRVVAVCFLFYEVGISRGYAMVAVAAIALGSGASLFRLGWAGGISIAAFMAASRFRGDFANVAFANPLVDGVVYPFINLRLMLDAKCGHGSTLDFVSEFIKKFMPSFLFPKQIFSFNVAMTRCIYPAFEDYISSVSVFTYLSELIYYEPSVLTALAAGCLLAVLCDRSERLLTRHGLAATRVFMGFMCIVLLRSRVLDVASFLIFLLLFLFTWGVAIRAPRASRRGPPWMDLAAARCEGGEPSRSAGVRGPVPPS
jgi:hypothetical protein